MKQDAPVHPGKPGYAAIDVVIPLYNAAETLDESLGSIANQTFTDFRVIAVDDGSQDDTAAMLERWVDKDPRFTVITRKNGGIVDALNAGLEAVTAPVIARMDGDDICHPDRFMRQYAYLRSNADCVAVGCAVDHMDEKGLVLTGMPAPGSPELADMNSLPALEPYIIHPFLMARTVAVRESGGYRNVPFSEDSDLFWRLAEVGRLYNLPETLGRYRMHMNSISGASVVNGRIMAIGSQLGAASARRRHRNALDMAFVGDMVPKLRAAGGFEEMARLAEQSLDGGERAHFRLASAVKLLELSRYRPYEIERGDCEFMRSALALLPRIDPAPRLDDLDWHLIEAGRRLLAAGRVSDAMFLVPGRLWLKLIAKMLLRRH